MFSCPFCNFKTMGCISCIDSHLNKHGVNVSGNIEPENVDILKFYSGKYNQDFKTIEELDKYIKDNNII